MEYWQMGLYVFSWCNESHMVGRPEMSTHCWSVFPFLSTLYWQNFGTRTFPTDTKHTVCRRTGYIKHTDTITWEINHKTYARTNTRLTTHKPILILLIRRKDKQTNNTKQTFPQQYSIPHPVISGWHFTPSSKPCTLLIQRLQSSLYQWILPIFST